MNESLLAATGREMTQIRDMPFWDAFWEGEGAGEVEAALTSAAESDIVHFECLPKSPDRGDIAVDATARPLRDDIGRPTGVLFEGNDIR